MSRIRRTQARKRVAFESLRRLSTRRDPNSTVGPAIQGILKSAVGTTETIAGTKRSNAQDVHEDAAFLQKFSTRGLDFEKGRKNKRFWRRVTRYRYSHGRVNHVRESFLLDPDGTAIFRWLGVVSLFVVYFLWSLIVRACMDGAEEGHYYVWLTMDVLGDLVFCGDIGIQLRTGYLEQGLIVSRMRQVCRHYITSHKFFVDMASVVPFHRILGIHEYYIYFRLLRLLKVYRFIKWYYMIEARTQYPNLIRVLNLVHILVLLCHWFACFYYLIRKTTPEFYPVYNTTSLTSTYLHCLYWSCLTLTTIGNGSVPQGSSE